MITPDPNEAPDANVARAKKKAGELETLIRKYLASNPVTLRSGRTLYKGQPGNFVIARREKDPPQDIAFDVVDVVSPLRSALDKAIHNIVAKNGKGTSGVGFPFGKLSFIELPSFASPSGLPQVTPPKPVKQEIYERIGENGAHKDLRKKLTPDQWSDLEARRPWPGPFGDNTAWAINEFQNINKHRGDIVRVSPVLRRRTMIGNGYTDFLINNPEDMDHLLTDKGREKVVLLYGDSAARSMSWEPSYDILFDNIPGLYGVPVVSSVWYQVKWVEDTINKLRRYF